MALEATHANNDVSRTALFFPSTGQTNGGIDFASHSYTNSHSENRTVEKSLDEPTQAVSDGATNIVGAAGMSWARKKSNPVRSACLQCRKRKTKCSGWRPTCQACQDRGLSCLWQVSEGLTRTEGLRQELQLMMSHVNDLETLVGRMRNGTDGESTMVLARLRLGESVTVQEMAHAARTEPAHRENDHEQTSPGLHSDSRHSRSESESLPGQNVDGEGA